MKIPQSLTTALVWSMVTIALLSAGMVGVVWIQQEYKKFSRELIQQKQQYINDQKAAIKEEIDRVMDYIDFKRTTTERKLKNNIRSKVEEAISIASNFYATYHDTKSDKEIQVLIRESLRPIRFNEGRGYFFIYDMQGNNILLPHSPNLEGTNLLNLKDSTGQYTIQRMLQMLQEKGEGFLRWHWYKPGETQRMSEKIGFCKYFKPYDWWIGTGEYIEDFEKDIQQETLDYINTIRFGNDGYIFVYDFNAITLAHYKPENIGVDQWNFVDANGLFVLRELISISQQKEGGYLEYVGTIRPSTGLPAPKLGYARAVMDWKWMVGCGVYIDSINEILAQKKTALIEGIKKSVLFIIGIILIFLLIIGFVSKYLTNKIMANIELFSRFFEKASKDAVKIENESVHFSEFKKLAVSANKMVDERNNAEESLNNLQEELNRSKHMEALGVLAGGVAHDLNNLLSGLVGYPDLILLHLPPDHICRKYILSIQDSGQKMASIVQDLLTLARRGVTQKVVLSLNNVIENYLKSPEHQNLIKNNNNIRLTTELEPDLLLIKGSQVHLQTTIMNLIANAAESQPNGGSIHLITQNISIDSKETEQEGLGPGDYISFSVRDEGHGINKADLDRVFEPFFSRKYTGKTSGTGLGMAVVWGTVKDHDGHIRVFSEENIGSTFELYFPVTRETMMDIREFDNIEDIRGNEETVLVVDDMQGQRDLAKDILVMLGYSVATAASGEEALEYLRTRKADILILDMIMEPGIDGLETFRQVIKIRAKQKAIIVSGYAETDRVKAARVLGAGQYVKKPYTVKSIGKAIKEELKRQ